MLRQRNLLEPAVPQQKHAHPNGPGHGRGGSAFGSSGYSVASSAGGSKLDGSTSMRSAPSSMSRSGSRVGQSSGIHGGGSSISGSGSHLQSSLKLDELNLSQNLNLNIRVEPAQQGGHIYTPDGAVQFVLVHRSVPALGGGATPGLA